MKVTVIGAGSTYTPELVEGILRQLNVLPVTRLTLYDVDRARLDVLGGLTHRMVAAVGASVRVSTTLDLVEAIGDAEFVLVQLRVGQQSARVLDETLPQRFGLLGQETTGPGGFGKALRTIRVVRDIADQVRVHAPEAWILNFTNPVGIVTRALLDDGHRVLGLCNVASSFTRLFAGLLGVDAASIELDHAGLNHLTWIRSVRVDGAERISELLAAPLRAEIAADIEQPEELLGVLDAIPSYYLKYFYATRSMTARQRENPRVDDVLRIERELLTMYADPGLACKPALLAQRGGAHYSRVAGALMCSLHAGDGARHYVNVRNGSTIAGLSPDAVVEVPALIDQDGASSVDVTPLPPELLSLVQSVTAYEELTLAAARSGRRDLAVRALVAHPLVREIDLAESYVDALLAADDLAPQLG